MDKTPNGIAYTQANAHAHCSVSHGLQKKKWTRIHASSYIFVCSVYFLQHGELLRKCKFCMQNAGNRVTKATAYSFLFLHAAHMPVACENTINQKAFKFDYKNLDLVFVCVCALTAQRRSECFRVWGMSMRTRLRSDVERKSRCKHISNTI